MDEFIDDAVRFPYGEKRTCLDIAKKLYRLAVLVRKEAQLALAEVAEREPDGVLKAAIVVLLASLGEEQCLGEWLAVDRSEICFDEESVRQ